MEDCGDNPFTPVHPDDSGGVPEAVEDERCGVLKDLIAENERQIRSLMALRDMIRERAR